MPPAFVNIQWKVYIIFGVFCTAMTIHVFFLFPETSGKSLEEIEAMFLKKIPAWKTSVDWNHIVAIERGDLTDKEAALQEHSPERPSEVHHTLEK